MKILFLHAGDRVPSSRFRVLPFAPLIRKAGHRCTLLGSFPQMYDYFPWLGFRPSQMLKRFTRRLHLMWAAFYRYDVIVISREIFDTPDLEFEKRFRKLARTLVLDIDDAVFQRYPEKCEQLTGMCDLVIAGNRYLKEYLENWNPNVIVIPTCVDTREYPAKKESAPSEGRCIIGWMGTSGNLAYLKVVAPALRELAAKLDFELRLIVPDIAPLRDVDLEGVRVKHIVWQGKTEVEELLKIDIGIMPLIADDEWCLYKCGLKLLQYMAIGVPTVSSPVGVNSEIVDEGINGYLASDTTQWKEAFTRLIEDAELRRKIGRAARERVVQKYSVQGNLPILLDALKMEHEKRG